MQWKKILLAGIALFALFALMLIFTPLIVSLEYALTIGGLLALALLSYLPVSVFLPMLQENE